MNLKRVLPITLAVALSAKGASLEIRWEQPTRCEIPVASRTTFRSLVDALPYPKMQARLDKMREGNPGKMVSLQVRSVTLVPPTNTSVTSMVLGHLLELPGYGNSSFGTPIEGRYLYVQARAMGPVTDEFIFDTQAGEFFKFGRYVGGYLQFQDGSRMGIRRVSPYGFTHSELQPIAPAGAMDAAIAAAKANNNADVVGLLKKFRSVLEPIVQEGTYRWSELDPEHLSKAKVLRMTHTRSGKSYYFFVVDGNLGKESGEGSGPCTQATLVIDAQSGKVFDHANGLRNRDTLVTPEGRMLRVHKDNTYGMAWDWEN